MVFYFSGTGNSYHVAKKLAEGLGEKMIDMARATREDAYEYTLKKGEKLGFVFPVHAWAPPQMVEQFVQRLELYYEEDVYTYAVCTCGQSARGNHVHSGGFSGGKRSFSGQRLFRDHAR